ncbi:hypothetical protein JRQ81_004947 [Phrynocephalus forsythii]|uniref:Uncharacterized protein n=1 Tax=Phrynocephalus forsythii TaxID=171643 RepID=A0A9Q1B6G2_9SAUR|nr:hypothetical protein JRQ81_004947 [Phrynocephalus forsythii]
MSGSKKISVNTRQEGLRMDAFREMEPEGNRLWISSIHFRLSSSAAQLRDVKNLLKAEGQLNAESTEEARSNNGENASNWKSLLLPMPW